MKKSELDRQLDEMMSAQVEYANLKIDGRITERAQRAAKKRDVARQRVYDMCGLT